MKTHFEVGKIRGYIDVWTQSSVHIHIYDTDRIFDSLALALRPRVKLTSGAWVPKKLFTEASILFREFCFALGSLIDAKNSFSLILSGHAYGAAIATMLAFIFHKEFPSPVIRLHSIGAPYFLSEQSAGMIAEMASCISYSYGIDILTRWRWPGTYGIGEPIHKRQRPNFKLKYLLWDHELPGYRSMVPYDI